MKSKQDHFVLTYIYIQ